MNVLSTTSALTYNDIINDAISLLDDTMSDTEKALALHDYLVLRCDYDVKYKYLDNKVMFTAYSALVNRVAVCQGYALAYIDLLNAAGIESKLVNSDEMNHAWVLVHLEDDWYHVDPTFNDPTFGTQTEDGYCKPGYVDHEYFLRSEERSVGKEC